MSIIKSNIEQENDTFTIWMPAEICKADGSEIEDGENVDYANMKLKGIASTGDLDMDGDIMMNNGFDVSYLMEKGFINWHHQSKNDPSMIIGEPEKAEITPRGLYLEAKLYEDSPVARKAYEMAKLLNKNSKKRKLGWSIEGKVIEKEGNVIKKAKVTGVALTHSPKNAKTFAELCKAMTDGSTTDDLLKETEYEADDTFILETSAGTISITGHKIKFVEKAMEAGSSNGETLMPESLEGGLKFPVSEHAKVIDRIMRKYPKISFKKACKVYDKILTNRKTAN